MIKILCDVNIDKVKKEIQQKIDTGLSVEEIVDEIGINISLF